MPIRACHFRIETPTEKHPFFAETEISEFCVTFLVEQNILRFEISIYNAPLMKIFQGEQNFGGVKSGFALAEEILLKEMRSSLSHSLHLKRSPEF